MQSHLEAALLGHSAAEDDDKDFPDEDAEDVDDFIDEVPFISASDHSICVSLACHPFVCVTLHDWSII